MIKYSPSGRAYVEKGPAQGKLTRDIEPVLESLGWQRITKFAPPGMFPPTVYGYEAKDIYEEELADEFRSVSDDKKTVSAKTKSTRLNGQ